MTRLQTLITPPVLIETYWNVKVLSAGGSGAQTGINRNILECKGKPGAFFVGGDMTQEQIDYVKKCIREDIHRFYVWGPWKKVRREVLQMDHGECQRCKAKKIYTKATTVHHVNYVKKHPDMALEIWYEWHGVRKRNLVSLCHDCHEAVHGYRKPEKKETLTEERWD